MKTLSLLAVFAVSALGLAVPSTPSAPSIVGAAEAAAHKEHKNVMVIFHASWCGWCHKFDDFLNNSKIAPIVKSSYEIIHVDVLENPDKKDLENSGGEEMLKQYGGDKAGIPYFVILSDKGRVLATSMKDGTQENIGYPGQPDEIKHFMEMLSSTSHLTEANRGVIRDYLVAHPQG